MSYIKLFSRIDNIGKVKNFASSLKLDDYKTDLLKYAIAGNLNGLDMSDQERKYIMDNLDKLIVYQQVVDQGKVVAIIFDTNYLKNKFKGNNTKRYQVLFAIIDKSYNSKYDDGDAFDTIEDAKKYINDKDKVKNFASDFIEMLSGRIDKIAEDRKAKDSMYDPKWTLIDSEYFFSDDEYDKYLNQIDLYHDTLDLDKKITTPAKNRQSDYEYGTLNFKGGVQIKYRKHRDKIEIETKSVSEFITLIKDITK